MITLAIRKSSSLPEWDWLLKTASMIKTERGQLFYHRMNLKNLMNFFTRAFGAKI